MKVLLPTNIATVTPTSVPEVPGVEWAWADPHAPIPAEHLDADVWAAWMNPAGVVADAAANLHRVRLVQSFAAGVENLLAAGFGPAVQICSGAGLHDRTVAEHLMSLLLALVRRIPDSVRQQASHDWQHQERINWQASADTKLHSLHGARVLIWGFGSIAASLTPMLQAFGAQVRGAARTAGERHGVPVVDESGLAAELAAADIVILLMPGGPETRHVLNAERLALLQPHALVLNAGRGTTIDQDALVEALRAGRLGGAGLDVVDPEPLPASSPLWDAPRLLITPHHGGGRPINAIELLLHNVQALQTGGELRNLVPRT